MDNWLVIGWTGHSGGEGDKPELAEDIFRLEEYPIVNSLVYSASMELLKAGKQEFAHPVSLEFNPAYQLISKYLAKELEPIEFSNSMVKLLHSKMIHPKVRASNLLVGEFDLEVDKLIFILKVEAFDRYISLNRNSISREAEGINNKSKYTLTVIKASEPEFAYVSNIEEERLKYWNEDFLGIIPVSDSFALTRKVLTAVASFSKDKIDDFDGDVFEAAKFRSKALTYIKEHSSFDKDDFNEKIFREDDRLSTLFDVYLNRQGILDDISDNTFEVSKAAIKRTQSQFSKSIQLDDTVVISIKSSNVRIDRGFDHIQGLKTLTIYFKEER